MQKKISIFYDSELSGHKVAARSYARAIELFNEKTEVSGITSGEWQSNTAATLDSSGIVIQCFIPPLLTPVNGAFNIAIFYHEWSRVPESWIRKLNDFDAVLVSSRYLENVLKECGCKARIIYASIPVSTNSSKVKTTWNTAKPFRFLSVGEWHFRKGFHLLIEAFKQAFGDNPDYQLTIKTTPGIDYSSAENIRIISERLPDDELLDLFTSSDAYVCTSLAEGFGLPVAEAMASKLPVISHNWSGLSEFCGEGRCLEIAFKQVPQPFCSNPDYYAPGQECGLIDINACADAMKLIAAWPADKRQAIAEKASQHVRCHLSLEKISDILMKNLTTE